MVFAFLCHSVAGTPCRILYSTVYGDDINLDTSHVRTLRELCIFKKKIDCRVPLLRTSGPFVKSSCSRCVYPFCTELWEPGYENETSTGFVSCFE